MGTVEPHDAPDAVEVARARTLAGVCAAQLAFSGLFWTTTVAILVGAVLQQSGGRPDLESLSTLVGGPLALFAAPAVFYAVRRTPRLTTHALLLGTFANALLAAPLLWSALSAELGSLDTLSFRFLYLDCAALPVFGTGLCAYTWLRHRRVLGTGGPVPSA